MAKIRLTRIAHVYYGYRNLEAIDSFLLDFGLTKVKSEGTRIYYRGCGGDPFIFCATRAEEDRFEGAAFVVESLKDLELASMLPSATPITALDAPGGGQIVTIRDPIDNIPFHFVHGQNSVTEEVIAEERPFNFVSL